MNSEDYKNIFPLANTTISLSFNVIGAFRESFFRLRFVDSARVESVFAYRHRAAIKSLLKVIKS